MSIFDSIRSKAGTAINKAVAAAGNKNYTVVLNTLPMSVEELKAMPQGSLKNPEDTAALVIAALAVYPAAPDASIAMINYMRNGRDLIGSDLQFVKERGVSHNNAVIACFKGATPENNYTPTEPATIEMMENAYSREQIKDGILTLYVKCNGADSPRVITLRQKASTGEWFFWSGIMGLLSQVKTPKAADPWA